MEMFSGQQILNSIPSKEFLPRNTSIPCGYCGGPILYRPTTIGLRESVGGHGIDNLAYFCSEPCKRAYVNGDVQLLNDETESQTTRIMRQFRDHYSDGDDPDSHRFLQKYDRFSQIPPAPPRHAWIRYGGKMSDEEYRKTWVQQSYITNSSTPTSHIQLPGLGPPPSSLFAPNLLPVSISPSSSSSLSPIQQNTIGIDSPQVIPPDELNFGPVPKVQLLSPIFGFCSRQHRGLARRHYQADDD